MDRIIYKAQYHGFPIYIKRFEIAPIFPSQRNTWLCGYVEIDRHHLLFGRDMDELENIDCHGGITFASVLDETDTYCIGFDCNHLGDNIEKQNKEFAIRECIYIIEQINGMPKKEARKIADEFPRSCIFEPFNCIFEKESKGMKTSEFVTKVESLGYYVEELVDMIHNFTFEVRADDFELFDIDERYKLLRCIGAYVSTPIQKREKPTKYYLRLKGTEIPSFPNAVYLNFKRGSGYYFSSNRENTKEYKAIFTQKEIDKLPRRLVQCFDKVEVEDENK